MLGLVKVPLLHLLVKYLPKNLFPLSFAWFHICCSSTSLKNHLSVLLIVIIKADVDVILFIFVL